MLRPPGSNNERQLRVFDTAQEVSTCIRAISDLAIIAPTPVIASMPIHLDPTPSRPLSLRQVVAQHPRERLHVRPVEWTACHLELLRCEFAEPTSSSPEHHSHDEPPSRLQRKRRAAAAKSWAEGYGISRFFGVRGLLSNNYHGQLCIFLSVGRAPPRGPILHRIPYPVSQRH